MSDEIDDIGGAEEEGGSISPNKRAGFLSPVLIKILGIVIGFIVVVVLIFVILIVFGPMIIQSKAPAQDAQTGPIKVKKEPLAKFKLEDPFRLRLRDGKMIQMKISLGYREKNKKLQSELSQIKDDIIDIVNRQLSRLDSSYFVDEEDGASLDLLEDDLLLQINKLLYEGKVQKIYFLEFTLM